MRIPPDTSIYRITVVDVEGVMKELGIERELDEYDLDRISHYYGNAMGEIWHTTLKQVVEDHFKERNNEQK